MDFVAHISCQNSYSDIKIIMMRICRYLQTGYLLHFITLLAVVLCIFSLIETIDVLKNANDWKESALMVYFTLYIFSLLFFSQLDAYSRYQNYKMIKDKIFYYGFDTRILKPFVYSRCQRDAISVAVRELNYSEEWKILMKQYDFRWFHLLPHIIIGKPSVLFTKQYWSKTLFVKTYHSNYFLW